MFLFLQFALLPLAAAQPGFRAESTLVVVPVTVMDQRGATVNHLHSGSFALWEDGLPQRIFSFSEEDVPASIGVVLDLSGSMTGKIGQAKAALKAFAGKANPEDEGFLDTVSTRPAKAAGLTPDLDDLSGNILYSGAAGDTALIDTVYWALDQLRDTNNPRKAILIISDGMDNSSRYSRSELMQRVLESDAQIYAISIYDPPAFKKPIELREEHRGLSLLGDLTEKTGGLHVLVRNAEDMTRAAEAIGYAMRNQYVLGYIPPHSEHDGKWHSVRVKLGPGMKAYTRSGYFAQ